MRNYLDLIKQHTGVALIYNNIQYTYEELVDLAFQFQSTLPKRLQAGDRSKSIEQELQAGDRPQSIEQELQAGDRPQSIQQELQDGHRPRSIDQNSNKGDRFRKQLYVIQEDNILIQLVKFLGCQGTDYIPVIAPQSFDSTDKNITNHPISDRAVMAVMTSGTTGSNKIYTRSFNSWADFFPIQNGVFKITKNSRVFTQGSLAFTGNLNTYMGALYAGATIIAESDFNPKKWAKKINKYEADVIYLIPSKLLCLTRIKEQMLAVKSIMSGSESLGKSDIPKLKQVFPNAEITLYYGASETNYITYIKDYEMNEKRNLIGKPFEGVGVSLATDGRFIIDSPYHVEEVTSPYIINDIGSMDDNGMYYFEGRIDDVINVKGIKTSLHKIKNALEELPQIKEAVVKYENQIIEAKVVLISQDKQVQMQGKKRTQDISQIADIDQSTEIDKIKKQLQAKDINQIKHINQAQEIDKIKKQLHVNLQTYEIPRKITVVSKLNTNESGKTIF